MIWNERAKPALTRSGIVQDVTSSPSKTTRPPPERAIPDSWWIKVVLPAPFGPMIACSSPTRTSRLTSCVTFRAP